MSVTHANKIESAQEPQSVKAMGEAAPQFADNRAATTAQLAMQQLMHSSPRSTAQRATANAMNASPVQQQKTIQRAESEEELQLEAIPQTAQFADMDEELLQGKFEPAQRAEKPNNTGLPDNLKSGIENLSGMSMDHVKVHYNSEKPAQLQAHAYAQGSEIHVAPGQEKHLPHEAWHVVQQAQGRVRPTVQMKGNVPVNDDVGLEREADLMGSKALSLSDEQPAQLQSIQLPTAQASIISVVASTPVAQLQIGPAGKVGDVVDHEEFALGQIKAKTKGGYEVEWFNDTPKSIVRVDDPKCKLFSEDKKSVPKVARKTKKNPNQKKHDIEMQKKAAEKQQREAVETQKMDQKRQRGRELWRNESNRLLALVDPEVKKVQKVAAWKSDIGRTFSALKSYLEEGNFPDSATDPELLIDSDDRDNQWKAEVWNIVATKKPRGVLPTRMDLWGFLVGNKMNANQVHYHPSGEDDLHLTVSGNSIDEIGTFDAKIFDKSPDSIYDHLFMKSAIDQRVHVTWQGEEPPKHLYVGGVNGLNNNFYTTPWSQDPGNTNTVTNMQNMLNTFRQNMIEKFVELKLLGWKLP